MGTVARLPTGRNILVEGTVMMTGPLPCVFSALIGSAGGATTVAAPGTGTVSAGACGKGGTGVAGRTAAENDGAMAMAGGATTTAPGIRTCPAGERVRCVGEAKGPMSCATGDDLRVSRGSGVQ